MYALVSFDNLIKMDDILMNKIFPLKITMDVIVNYFTILVLFVAIFVYPWKQCFQPLCWQSGEGG